MTRMLFCAESCLTLFVEVIGTFYCDDLRIRRSPEDNGHDYSYHPRRVYA